MTDNFVIKAGDKAIRLTTYPSGCQVTITVNDVGYKKETGPSGIALTLNEALKSGDNVDILIEKDGWKSLNNFIKIR